MAQRVKVFMEDDVDGTADDSVATVEFALDGVSYEIDLSADNQQSLKSAIAPYVAAARKVGGRKRRVGGTAPARMDREQLTAMRVWARSQGYQVSDRGRLAAHILAEYHQAH